MSRFVRLCSALLLCLSLGPPAAAPSPIHGADAPLRAGRIDEQSLEKGLAQAGARAPNPTRRCPSRCLTQGRAPRLARGFAENLPLHLVQNPAPDAKEGSCTPANIACRCSFRCCGEERCDGSICNQCVIDCVQRQQADDQRFQSLRARCQSLIIRGFKRL